MIPLLPLSFTAKVNLMIILRSTCANQSPQHLSFRLNDFLRLHASLSRQTFPQCGWRDRVERRSIGVSKRR